jgi:hypothetical protein
MRQCKNGTSSAYRPQCEHVRIEVAVEDGKVRLRAWPAGTKPPA